MRRFWPLALVAAPLLLVGSRSEYSSAQHKFDLIENGRVRPGSRVSLSERELNAYVQQELPKVVPQGVREPKLQLGPGTATGSALIDFLKLESAHGTSPGFLLRQLLQGERPVTVTARISSGNGRATVEVESVDVGGMTIQGRLLDYLIRNYLHAYYPDAKVGQPFDMSYRIDRLEIQPARVNVFMKR
jgi:hypothetical protein